MVECLTNLPVVESEVGIAQVAEAHNSSEDDQEWVVTITRWVKWIVSKLIAIWLIVNTGLLLEGMAAWVSREDVLMVVQWQV